MVTFTKTGNRLIALAHDPVARGRLYEMAKEDIEFSSIQLMELDNLHQVGYAPVNLGVYNKGDTVPHWVAPTDETVTVRTVITGITAPPVTSWSSVSCQRPSP